MLTGQLQTLRGLVAPQNNQFAEDKESGVMGRKSEGRQCLIDAAIHLMEARGYSDVGVQELCDQAGVNKGSFYYFFPSKRDLTLAALDHLWEIIHEQVLRPVLDGPGTPEERIRKVFEVGFARQNQLKETHGHCLGCTFGNLAVEMAGQDSVIQERLASIFRQWVQALTRVLEPARLDPSPAVRDQAISILAFFEGLMLLARTHDDPEMLMRLGPRAVGLLDQPNCSITPESSEQSSQPTEDASSIVIIPGAHVEDTP